MTQGAVSKQIIALEDFIGVKLFERHPGGLQLTLEGIVLKRVTLPAFDLLLSGFTSFRRYAPSSVNIRIATLTSFAQHVLVPRLDGLETEFPKLQLQIFCSDRLLDHELEQIDFAIRYGRGDAEGLVCEPVGTTRLIAVRHPNYPLDTATKRLFQVFFIDEWKTWEKAHGDVLFHGSKRIFVEDLNVALNGVLTQKGLAVLPHLIVQDLIAQGRLVAIGEVTNGWEYQYYLAHLPRTRPRALVTEVIAWLLQYSLVPIGPDHTQYENSS